MSDAEVLGTLAEAFERMSAGASPTGNYFFAVNAADAAASLKRIDGAASEIERLRGDLEVARLRLEAAHAEIARLRLAIRRLAEQDATLSVCDGAVTVTMDATLTDAEREAVEWAAVVSEGLCQMGAMNRARTLLGILERLG